MKKLFLFSTLLLVISSCSKNSKDSENSQTVFYPQTEFTTMSETDELILSYRIEEYDSSNNSYSVWVKYAYPNGKDLGIIELEPLSYIMHYFIIYCNTRS